MTQVEIRFGEGREGLMPLDTFLGDAARRLGISRLQCDMYGHHCDFEIDDGIELLSPVTDEEREQIEKLGRTGRVRLGCFAQIIKPGELNVMTTKANEKTTEPDMSEKRSEAYRKEFAELPLEKKIANLVRLEAITISETLAYVINSPFTVFDKIGDVLAEFGFKKEEEEKKRSRPAPGKAQEKKTQTKRSSGKERDATV